MRSEDESCKCKLQNKYQSFLITATCLVCLPSLLRRSFPKMLEAPRGVVAGAWWRAASATPTEDAMRVVAPTACGLGLGCAVGADSRLGGAGLARRRSSGRRPCGCAHFDRVDRHRAANTHSKAKNLLTGTQNGPAAHMAASLRPHGSHPIRLAVWRLELLFGGPGRVETPRPGPEKLGAVGTDRDLLGMLLTLI